MTDPIKDYARAVAEAAATWADGPLDDEDRSELFAYLDAFGPKPPVMQHHAAPTCRGWWWARFKKREGWAPVFVAEWGERREDRHVYFFGRNGTYTGDTCDRWVGPLRSPGDAD